ncbi:MAG: methylated-DNA--[protein]-cysteine S-methyltransferase [Phycisphaerae bacterium]
MMAHLTFDTALGRMAVAADARGVVRVVLPGDAAALSEIASPPIADAAAAAEAVADRAARELAEYAAGRRRSFTVPVRLDGLTAFRRALARALRQVPFGRTVTYGDLARRAGRPGAARAVGRAMAANPLPILVPCHRVVAANGLGGYGGGLALKRRLLALEGAAPGSRPPVAPR